MTSKRRFFAAPESGPHMVGKPERWAVYEDFSPMRGFARRYRAAHREDAEREAARLNNGADTPTAPR